MHPDAELELHAASHGLLADEAQHLEVAVALRIGQLRDADLVSRNVEQERIGEQEVSVGDAADEVVADAEGEVEAVEALGGQHGQIGGPHLAVVVPGLVFHVAGEESGDAADDVGGLLHDGSYDGERGGGIGGVLDAVGKFQEGVHLARGIVGGGEEYGTAARLSGHDGERFRCIG